MPTYTFEAVNNVLHVRRTGARPDALPNGLIEHDHTNLIALLHHEIGEGRRQVAAILELA